MTALQANTRRVNPSNAILVIGLVVALLAVMFRPSGAEAVLPAEAIVFKKFDDNSGATVKYDALRDKMITAPYDIKFKNDKTFTRTPLTGIPLIEFLKNAGVDTAGVQFAKVRVGTSNDSNIYLLPLNPEGDSGRPSMVLDSGKKPGGYFKTPALVPSQPTDAPLSEKQIFPFTPKGPDAQQLTIIPAKPGAKILGVNITKKKTRAGQYKLTAKVSGSGGGALKYEWFSNNSTDGKESSMVSNKSTFTTTDATSGTRTHNVTVVVTESGSESVGADGFGYTSKKSTNDDKTTNPYKAPPSTTPTTPGNGVIPPVISPTPGSTPGGSPSTITPPSTTPPPTSTPPPTTPPETVQPEGAIEDTSAITNAAQNTQGVGKFVPVSGILLSTPTVPPTAGTASGSALNELPPTVATELNSLFQPVEDPGDLWPYLITILFAVCFTGAVREWVNP